MRDGTIDRLFRDPAGRRTIAPMSEAVVGPSLSTRLRRAAGCVPSGVAVLAAGETRLTVSSLQCVSFDPPWISVSIERASRRGQALAAAGAFVARVLAVEEQAWARAVDQPLPEARGVVELDAAIRQVLPVGDHDLVLAEVTDVRFGEHRAPLVYWRRAFFGVQREYPWLASADAFHAFISAWEQGTLPKAAWTHAAHVAVGACYVVRHGADALSHTRAGIVRYNTAVGTANTDTSGYHETLTRFWSTVVAGLVGGMTDEWEAARLAVDRVGEDRDRHTLHYGFDVVGSVEARRTWVPPDLAPLGSASTVPGATR